MKLSREEIESLLRLIANTKTEEVDCDDMMQALAQFGEKLAHGQTGDDVLDALIQHHLKICPECNEEFDMLRAIVDDGSLGDDEQQD
ncbi:hypothetical protein OAH18_02750 [bacterium]|nr:hypothetical protein [bacterium]